MLVVRSMPEVLGGPVVGRGACRTPAGILPIALATVLLAPGCTSFAEPPGRDAGARPVAEVGTSAPDEELTVIADADPVAAAVSTSRALFDSAEVVVVAGADDVRATLLGAATAVGLGVPLLVESPNGDADLVADELDRLGVTTVLGVGDVSEGRPPDAGGAEREVVVVPADAALIADLTGLEFAPAAPVAPGDEPSAVADLEPGEPVALVPDGPTSGGGKSDPGRVPEVTRAQPLTGTVVLAAGGPESVAGIATARAAGARVLLTGGGADPRAVAEVGEALSEASPERVVALGAGFAEEQGLDWKIRTASSGRQLPAGGQLLFPASFLVALYGTPGSGALGVLGEQGLEASIERARDTAAPYDGLVDATVVPAFEIIATVASSSPGPDGNHSTETDLETLRPWVEAAGEAGLYVVLDLQPGRTDFLTQAQQYRTLLELPHVGLALDPEWRLGPGEVHLQQVGSVGVDEVNAVVTWLADLTRDEALPQKLLVLHQFRLDMIGERERLDTSRDELAVMVHADGQGAQPDKQATWQRLHEAAPARLWWGWKNFYDEDLPMLTPEQTVASVSPLPQLISYQ